MSFALRLTHDEPRLVYLALVYHLGRPGSELDPSTVQPVEHGLRAVKTTLGNDLEAPEAIIELDDRSYERLLSAMYGAVNELRVHHMRAGAPSTTPRFTDTALSLFPELRLDPEAALELSEAMMMLHRRIERAVAKATGAGPPPDSAPQKRGRWPFRRS
jgi:hypothetical protein